MRNVAGPERGPTGTPSTGCCPTLRLAVDRGALDARAARPWRTSSLGSTGEVGGPARAARAAARRPLERERALGTPSGAWLIDPAAHGGHRETDLAMLALFGSPHLDAVLAAYDEAAPLAAGWRDRVRAAPALPAAGARRPLRRRLRRAPRVRAAAQTGGPLGLRRLSSGRALPAAARVDRPDRRRRRLRRRLRLPARAVAVPPHRPSATATTPPSRTPRSRHRSPAPRSSPRAPSPPRAPGTGRSPSPARTRPRARSSSACGPSTGPRRARSSRRCAPPTGGRCSSTAATSGATGATLPPIADPRAGRVVTRRRLPAARRVRLRPRADRPGRASGSSTRRHRADRRRHRHGGSAPATCSCCPDQPGVSPRSRSPARPEPVVLLRLAVADLRDHGGRRLGVLRAPRVPHPPRGGRTAGDAATRSPPPPRHHRRGPGRPLRAPLTRGRSRRSLLRRAPCGRPPRRAARSPPATARESRTARGRSATAGRRPSPSVGRSWTP